MLKHEEKFCPRCHSAFECKEGSVLLCQCNAVRLSEQEQNYLRHRFDDCLCAKCMKELRTEFQTKRVKTKK